MDLSRSIVFEKLLRVDLMKSLLISERPHTVSGKNKVFECCRKQVTKSSAFSGETPPFYFCRKHFRMADGV